MQCCCIITPQVSLQSDEDVSVFHPQSCEMGKRGKSHLAPTRGKFMRRRSKSACQVFLFNIFTNWTIETWNSSV